MYRKIIHLLILPIVLAGLISGCLRAQAVQMEGRELGGITIEKTDVGGNPLSGAVFRVAREASWEELMNPSIHKALLEVEDTHVTVVYASFRIADDPSAPPVTEAVTGLDGKVSIGELPWGSYYLVETRAPEGFRQIRQPVRISVHKYSHLTAEHEIRDDTGQIIDNTVHIINVRYSLPQTGEGNAPVLLAGITGLVFSAASLVMMAVRKVKA